MCQFLQSKAAPIRHRSHECRKKLFHTSHLTSRPLQNYPPQPLGRDCWERNQLIAAPCCYRVLGTVGFCVQNIVIKRTVDEALVSGVGFHIHPVEVINVSTLGAAFINYGDISSVVNTCRVLHQGKTLGTTAPSLFTQIPYVCTQYSVLI